MRNRMPLFVLLMLTYIASVQLYNQFIQPTNEYLGFAHKNWSIESIVCSILGIALIVMVLPKQSNSPVGIFSIVYALLCGYSVLLYGDARGTVKPAENLGYFALLTIFPIAILQLARRISKARCLRLFAIPTIVEHAIFAITAATLISILIWKPPSAGFRLDTIYIRRLEARDIFTAGTMLSYMIGATANGLLPAFSFLGGYYKKLPYISFAIAGSLVYYYVLGLRAIFVYSIVCFSFGLLLRSKYHYRLAHLLALTIGSIVIISMIELHLFGYSFVGDHIVRRALVIPGYVVGGYIELIHNGQLSHDLLLGAQIPDLTYFVGEALFNNSQSNANTNAFIYEYTIAGLVGFGLLILFLVTIFTVLETLWKSQAEPTMCFFAFIFAIILSEQRYTTSLLSSGIAILFMWVVLRSNFRGTIK